MSISLSLVFTTPTQIIMECSGTNQAPGGVYAKVFRGGSLVASQYVTLGSSFSFEADASGLTCGTSYGFSATITGATSGSLYESTSASYSTDACPGPFFPPYFPFFPPFFPPYFPPFFPPFFPFFPPFFPPYFPPTPVWNSNGNVLANSTEVEGQAITTTTFSAQYVSSYALYSGSLPSGVTISTSGVLSGTPSQGSAGTYNFVISASGDGGTIYTGTLTMTVLDDGGKAYIYNDSTSQWEESTVYVYNGTTWVQSDVYIYNSGSSSWEKST